MPRSLDTKEIYKPNPINIWLRKIDNKYNGNKVYSICLSFVVRCTWYNIKVFEFGYHQVMRSRVLDTTSKFLSLVATKWWDHVYLIQHQSFRVWLPPSEVYMIQHQSFRVWLPPSEVYLIQHKRFWVCLPPSEVYLIQHKRFCVWMGAIPMALNMDKAL